MEFTFNLKLPRNPERQRPENVEQEMMDQASAFFQAGSRCEADFRLSPNITNALTAPAAVCYSFALEIYLKLLRRLAQVAPEREHALIKLFDGLPEGVVAIIARHHAVEASRLRTEIESVSNAFVEWRYLYEQPMAGISITALAQLCAALHRTVREVKPDLLVTFENRLAVPPNEPQDGA